MDKSALSRSDAEDVRREELQAKDVAHLNCAAHSRTHCTHRTQSTMSASSAELIYAEFGDGCDLYEVLGVAKTASEKDITRAYRKLALKYVRPLCASLTSVVRVALVLRRAPAISTHHSTLTSTAAMQRRKCKQRPSSKRCVRSTRS